MSALPRILVTSGEPAGIGPDLCLMLARKQWPCQLTVAGDRRVLGARARQLGLQVQFRDQDSPTTSHHEIGALRIANIQAANTVVAGALDPANAGYVVGMLDLAARSCLRGDCDAIVTAPVQKSVINDAGIPFTGHTEYFAERSGADQPVMMLVAGSLRVALLTTHLPLREVSNAVTPELLDRVLQTIDRDLRAKFAIDTPKILVCGLNPHAGEGGHLGREEIEVIEPVLNALRLQGMQVIGPVPADTAFTPHKLVGIDAVLAMYHDQGLPVLKHVGFGHAVNVTLGLPIVRTSVDHGTALELAGTGKADAGSLETAVQLAIDIVNRQRR